MVREHQGKSTGSGVRCSLGGSLCLSGKRLTRSLIPWAPSNPNSLGAQTKQSMPLGCQGDRDTQWSTSGRAGSYLSAGGQVVSHEDVGPLVHSRNGHGEPSRCLGPRPTGDQCGDDASCWVTGMGQALCRCFPRRSFPSSCTQYLFVDTCAMTCAGSRDPEMNQVALSPVGKIDN